MKNYLITIENLLMVESDDDIIEILEQLKNEYNNKGFLTSKQKGNLMFLENQAYEYND